MRATLRVVVALTLLLGFGVAFATPAWSVVSSVSPAGPPNGPSSSAFLGVSCAGTAPCFAVGQRETATATTATLIEAPTGSGWTVVPSPNASGATASTLSGVSCSSSTFCAAVGSSSTKSLAKTLIERWNGATWSIRASPNHGADSSALASVSCTSKTSCFAVGSFDSGSSCPTGAPPWECSAPPVQTLVERWNGATWSIVPSPNLALQPGLAQRDDSLSSVSCATETSCFAVGSDDRIGVFDGSFTYHDEQTLVERWNGSTWSILKSPNPGTDFNELSSVSCPSANSCFAVGSFHNSAPATVGYSLVAHWNGTAWTHVTSANVAKADSTQLSGVSCSTPTSCVAVGDADHVSSLGGQGSTLIETPARTGWSINPSPDPATSSGLSAVSCTNVSSCYAVGTGGTRGPGSTLVEAHS